MTPCYLLLGYIWKPFCDQFKRTCYVRIQQSAASLFFRDSDRSLIVLVGEVRSVPL
jgi:hypothetical protein